MPRLPTSPAGTGRDTRRHRHRRDDGRCRKGPPCPRRPGRPFDQTGTITVLLISATLVDALLIRLTVQPKPQNGLLKPSQIQIDKAMSVQRHKVGAVIGRLDDASMLAVMRSLALSRNCVRGARLVRRHARSETAPCLEGSMRLQPLRLPQGRSGQNSNNSILPRRSRVTATDTDRAAG